MGRVGTGIGVARNGVNYEEPGMGDRRGNERRSGERIELGVGYVHDCRDVVKVISSSRWSRRCFVVPCRKEKAAWVVGKFSFVPRLAKISFTVSPIWPLVGRRDGVLEYRDGGFRILVASPFV